MQRPSGGPSCLFVSIRGPFCLVIFTIPDLSPGEQILGLPPMNQHDLVTPPIRSLFTNTPDYTPYTALPNNIPLNQLTTQQTVSRTSKLQLAWRQESAKMFARPQRADSADPNILNHAIWYATKGFNTPYPGDKTVLFPNQVKRSPYRVTYDD
jgi:hypothetical protein